MSAEALPAGHVVVREQPPIRWIVSPRYDLCFFIGSAVFTFLFYLLYREAGRMGWFLGGDQILVTYFVFTAFFDHPHIFQTFARTHADPEEFQRRKGLHTWGLAAFVGIGIVVALLRLESELIVFAAIYGTWHIIRQHFGFIRLYKSLNEDKEPLDNWLDYGTFYSGAFACLLNDYTDLREPIHIYGALRVRFPDLPSGAGEALWGVFLVLLVLLGFRQVWLVGLGRRPNLPKLLLMSTALFTHWFVFFATATPFLVAEALETAYHDIQYQGWIMHYQRRRFAVRHVVLKWALLALAYGLCVGAIETLGLMRAGWSWLFVPFTMLVIWHYFVDGKIWKFSQDSELRAVFFSPREERGEKTTPIGEERRSA
ncbi:MAG TPA: hypothetical protein VK689_03635 [Armatimonadota bacterium]|nr:hypothetical protein [Armatimonadota bacterium]